MKHCPFTDPTITKIATAHKVTLTLLLLLLSWPPTISLFTFLSSKISAVEIVIHNLSASDSSFTWLIFFSGQLITFSVSAET